MSEFDAEKRVIYVKFGPRDDDELPLSWAESLLRILKDEHPAVFGEAMLKSKGIAKKTRGSR